MMLENCYLNFLTTLHLLKRFESYLRQGIRFLQLILPEKIVVKLNMQNLGHKIASFCGWRKCMTPIAMNLWWRFGLKMLVFLEWGKSHFPLQAYNSFNSFLGHFPIPHISNHLNQKWVKVTKRSILFSFTCNWLQVDTK